MIHDNMAWIKYTKYVYFYVRFCIEERKNKWKR